MAEPLKLRAKILIGIPVYQPDERFLEVLPKFVLACKEDYDIQVLQVVNHQLVDAQNIIAAYFLQETDCSHLLILENDHWGHSKAMLDAMVNKDVDVCAMNYHSRHFPYPNCLMRRIPNAPPDACFSGLTYSQGFYTVDMAGYAMMLLKRGVFSRLGLPFFRLNALGGPDSYATDVDFCTRLLAAGFDIWGCFDYCLPHRDITKENHAQKVQEEMELYQKNSILEKLKIHRKLVKEGLR